MALKYYLIEERFAKYEEIDTDDEDLSNTAMYENFSRLKKLIIIVMDYDKPTPNKVTTAPDNKNLYQDLTFYYLM